MSAGRSRRSLLVCSLLVTAGTAARAQVAPPAAGIPATTIQAAVEARAAGRVVEVTDAGSIVGCRYLGEAAADSSTPGPEGRAQIRTDLRGVAVARGASHLDYSAYSDGKGYAQSEHARFFDCTGGAVVTRAVTASASVAAAVEAREPVDVIYADPPPRVAVGLQLDVLPYGNLKEKLGEDAISLDLKTAMGIAVSADYLVTPWLAIGGAPRIVFGVAPEGAEGSSSSTQIDLRGRVRAGRMPEVGLGVTGYLAAGGAVLVGQDDSIWLPMIGAGVGATYAVRGSAYISLEIGYQIARTNRDSMMGGSELTTSLMHVGVGVGSYL